MILAHSTQFLAVNLQLFVSAYYRKNYATCLSIIQVFLVVIAPVAVIILQLIWLSIEHTTYFDTVYYKYIASDMLINVVAGWTYLGKL